MLAYKLKAGQLFMAKQLARLGNQEKTFSCLLCYSLASGKRASVKLHHCSIFSVYLLNNDFLFDFVINKVNY